MSDFIEQHPDLEALAAELRMRFERELRWESEDVESETLKQILRRRDLGDVARELMSAGDRVAASSRGLTIVGQLNHAKGDLAIVDTGHAVVSLNLDGPVTLRRIEAATAGGISSAGGSGSFKARMAEFEMTAEPIGMVTATLPDVLVGRIAVAAEDHIVLGAASGNEWFIRFADIAMVIQPLSRR